MTENQCRRHRAEYAAVQCLPVITGDDHTIMIQVRDAFQHGYA
ncbi:MAG: hypothetical protein OXF56_23470 [Rhodobacteraceae bacterium]|nr:hypothetical protein [Paracoccaceae bacterium]